VRFVAQPIVDLVRGTIPAVELLARPAGGGSLADWSIDELAARSRSLAHAALDAAATLPHDVGLVHVNVTALDLDESDFSEQVLRRFPRHRKHLILELTEQFELQSSRTVRGNLRRLREAGVRFALDDFGEGWASMVSMRLLRPAIVKVTTKGLQGKTLLDAEVSEWLIERSAAVGCHRVVVEQLDTLEKVERVHALGFRLGQGRLLDRYVLESLPGTDRASAPVRSGDVRLEHASLTLIA
jgi:EAL domain-containing protein (putative c-di-GMP-specific phosphodiesterase class I)